MPLFEQFLTIHPHNGILPFLLIKPVDPPKKSTGFCIASQHAQGMTLFERFFLTPTHPHDGILSN
jgi:hypothetical protein